MRIKLSTPARSTVVARGMPVQVARSNESWSELTIGEKRSEKGVYVIHHNGKIKYVGKTSGKNMNFGKRLRRHFQKSAAGNHTYSTTAWYACANPRQHSGIEVVTLEGSRGMPLLEKMTQWVSDAIEWRVLFDVVVLPVDYRTWVYNAGA